MYVQVSQSMEFILPQQVERDIVKLSPVMELKSHVTYVKDVATGTAISYGGTFVADRKLRVATIPVGYADGYPQPAFQ